MHGLPATRQSKKKHAPKKDELYSITHNTPIYQINKEYLLERVKMDSLIRFI